MALASFTNSGWCCWLGEGLESTPTTSCDVLCCCRGNPHSLRRPWHVTSPKESLQTGQSGEDRVQAGQTLEAAGKLLAGLCRTWRVLCEISCLSVSCQLGCLRNRRVVCEELCSAKLVVFQLVVSGVVTEGLFAKSCVSVGLLAKSYRPPIV